jgi:hypothetical protein
MAKKRARDADGQSASAHDPTVVKMDEDDSSDDDVGRASPTKPATLANKVVGLRHCQCGF